MAIIKVCDVDKPITLWTNLDPRQEKERKLGFEVFYSFTGFSLPFIVERGIERAPGEKDWVPKHAQN